MAYDSQRLAREAMARLEARPARSLASICQELGIGRHALARIIAAGSGATFREHRERMILRQLRELSAERPDWAVKQLADALGFSSASALARAVHRATGMTPRAWTASRR